MLTFCPLKGQVLGSNPGGSSYAFSALDARSGVHAKSFLGSRGDIGNIKGAVGEQA